MRAQVDARHSHRAHHKPRHHLPTSPQVRRHDRGERRREHQMSRDERVPVPRDVAPEDRVLDRRPRALPVHHRLHEAFRVPLEHGHRSGRDRQPPLAERKRRDHDDRPHGERSEELGGVHRTEQPLGKPVERPEDRHFDAPDPAARGDERRRHEGGQPGEREPRVERPAHEAAATGRPNLPGVVRFWPVRWFHPAPPRVCLHGSARPGQPAWRPSSGWHAWTAAIALVSDRFDVSGVPAEPASAPQRRLQPSSGREDACVERCTRWSSSG